MRNAFEAKYRGVCGLCWDAIEVGDSVHYDPDGVLVHNRHDVVERPVSLCNVCHLAKPCFCD